MTTNEEDIIYEPISHNNTRTGLTYDDILLVPGYSEIISRKDPDISSKLGNQKYDVPVISANMNKVTEWKMVKSMIDAGATGAFHRFMSPEKLLEEVNTLLSHGDKYKNKFGISIGVKKEEYDEYLDILRDYIDDIGYIVIDVAHGHHKLVLSTFNDVKYRYNIPIVAGNIASLKAAIDYYSWGIRIFKIGIGGGSVCKSRTEMAVGYPQFSIIDIINRYFLKHHIRGNVTIISDGGIKKIGDITKALAVGSDFVMVGGMLAGSKETPGNVLTIQNKKYKLYEGMASIDAQVTFKNKEAEDIIAEGEVMLVPYKESAYKIMKYIEGTVKAAFSYYGCKNLYELHKYGLNHENWVINTQAAIVESLPHGLLNK